MVFLPLEFERDTRITVKLSAQTEEDFHPVEAEAVSPVTPREEQGYYWGYDVRQASSLSNVFTECPFDGGYDISVGMSERGADVASILDSNSESVVQPSWNHLLIVFGGVAGLEAALAADRQLLDTGIKKPSEIFDHWINLVPGQGSRTIRTEEAVWIGLAVLQPLVARRASS